MAKLKTWILLTIYLLLVGLDIGLNILAIFIPSLGGLAESLTEGVIELTSAIIVFSLAFAKGDRK